jgi:hypothetical protein
LGSVNFYRRFLPRAAQFLKLLTDSLRSQLQWTAEMTNFFQAMKLAMVAYLHSRAEICVMVDASADHVRAALQQKTSASAAWQLVFFSKLEPAQMKYLAFNRELWACVGGRHLPLYFLLEGWKFAILTDHKPLTYAQVAASTLTLEQVEFVYIRGGGMVPPLQPLYQGPYRVLGRAEKFLKIQIGARNEVVSVDRLKPHRGSAPV